MIRFGFSAYLRILCMKPRPQRRELLQRLMPTGNGYDFHKQTRALVTRLAAGATLSEVLGIAEGITNPSERSSACRALSRFDEWSSKRMVSADVPPRVVYVSPDQKFSVNFEPQFILDDSSGIVPVHVWNTKIPSLEDGLVVSALYLAYSRYFQESSPVGNVGILSIPERRLRMIPDPMAAAALSRLVVRNLESTIAELEGGLSDADDQPRPSGRLG